MSDTNNSLEAKLDGVIDTALDHLGSFDEETEEYSKTLTQVERLFKARNSLQPEPPAPVEEKKRAASKLEPWIPVIGTILSIGFVGIMEIKGHAMASKAASFIPKLK